METLREPSRADVQERLGGIVSKGIWRASASPMLMFRTGIIGG